MKKFLLLLFVFASFLLVKPVLADSYIIDFENPPYTTGTINNQDGWTVTGPYDQGVVSSPIISGTQSFRLSNAVTSGSFGDQTFSKSLTNEAGEVDSTNGGMSGGVRQSHFEAQFDFTSTQLTEQPGLFISVSPDRGDGSRMSYLGFQDTASGVDVIFYDVQGENPGFQTANFVSTTVSSGLSRSEKHTAKFVIDFNDGPSNDVVKIFIDGVLKHTGTTWENYYRFDTEASAEQSPRTTDDLIFRAGGAAAPGNLGKGFIFDNLSLLSGPVSTPPTSVVVHIFKYIDGVQATTESADGKSFPMFTSTYNAPFTLGPGGWTTGDIDYEASTGPMSVGSAYSFEEKLDTDLVGMTCDGVHQYSLQGYSTGDSLLAAQQAEPSTVTPNFTGLQGDKYVIVRNIKCPPVQKIKVHVLKYLDGIKADIVSAAGYLFPMTSTWNAANIGAGSGNYSLGNNHGGAVDLYGAVTSEMTVPVDYTTSEITDNGSEVVSSITACLPGKYLLQGYRVSDISFVDAATKTLSLTAPQLTDITSDRFIIVENTKCPTKGVISGMKYNDKNRNGFKDANEPGLSGWTIRLKLANKVVATTVTDSQGNYTFSNLNPGMYKVREVHQKGWKRMSKNPKPILVTQGSNIEDVNFGNARKFFFEREDTDRDDDHDDKPGYYYPGHGNHHYENDQRGKGDNHDRR